MADENTDLVNFDLNPCPSDNSNDIESYSSGSLNLGDRWDRQGYSWMIPRVIPRHESLQPWSRDPNLFEMGDTADTGLSSRNAPETGPNSVVSEIRPVEISKNSEKRSGFSTDETQDKKEDGKNYNNESGFFYCNICLELAKEPIVTCCGHLFCWPCIYRWLDHHSSAKECPVCKGKVTVKNITPIYGPVPNTSESDVDSSMKIPPRPQALRAERLSQLRGAENSFDLAQTYSTTTNIPSPISSSESVEAEFFFGSYLHINLMESILEPAPTFEDRDSMSNNAVIHYGGQTVDDMAEIDSTVSHSTRSSRTRNGASRDSDAASGDSPGTRRRRLS